MADEPEFKRLLACGLCAATIALSGCKVFRTSCEAPPSAAEVATIPALNPPEGITAPDTRNALRIPDLADAETPRAKSDPCLEAPPRYSPGWAPDEKAKEIKPGDPEAKANEEPKKKRKWWPWGKS